MLKQLSTKELKRLLRAKQDKQGLYVYMARVSKQENLKELTNELVHKAYILTNQCIRIERELESRSI